MKAPAPGNRRPWQRALALLWLLVLAAPVAATAPEFSIKAAYLYKFASYVEWPDGTFPSPQSPLVIGVIGDNELADELGRIVSGQTVQGHPVQTRRLQPDEPLAGVNVLLIGRLEGVALQKVLANAREHAVVTVTESEDGFAQGSMINLLVVENKVRFEVALGPVESAHLHISARMLSAAYSVQRGPK